MRYVFYVVTDKDQELRWPGLTKRQAHSMYIWTRDASPFDVVKFGWEEMA